MLLNNFFEKHKEKKAKHREEEKEKLEKQLYYLEHEKEIIKSDRKLESRHEYLYEKINDYMDVVSEGLSFDFNFKKRISIMKKIISLYDEFEEIHFKIYGKDDKYDLDEFTKDYDLKSKRVELDIHNECYEYQPEYENELESISFLRKLLDYYENHVDEVKKHLKEEEYKYRRESYDSFEDYENALSWEIEVKKFEKSFKKYVLEHDGIIQKDLLKNYDDKYSKIIHSSINSLVERKIIRKEKCGNSYKIIVCNKN